MLKKMLIWVFGVLFLLPDSHQVLAIEEDTGVAGATFLEIGLSPRAAAMGEAFCAIADDASVTYYNPAGLSQIEDRICSLMHTNWFEGVNYEYLSWVESRGNQHGFGASLAYLGMSDMQGNDINQQSQGMFGANDMCVTLAYARPLLDKLFGGVGLKFIQQELAEEISSCIAADFGLLWKNSEPLSLGLSVSNLGTKIKFIKDKEKLPVTVRTGLAYRLLKDRALISLDLKYPPDHKLNFGIGSECMIAEKILLRVGYKSRNDLGNGISLGFGINERSFQVDYCFSPYERVGDVHRVSLQLKLRGVKGNNHSFSAEASRQTEGHQGHLSATPNIKNENLTEAITPKPIEAIEPKPTVAIEPKPTEAIKPKPIEPVNTAIATTEPEPKQVTQWIRGNKYRVTANGGERVWLRIGEPKSGKVYFLEEATQVVYLGEKAGGFYKVMVTSEGLCKGREGWVWGWSLEESID